MEDVDKLDNIQDGFIHCQLMRFCQATRLQCLNGQIDLANQNVLQQQHVNWKISNALLKKGTRDTYKTWCMEPAGRAWVDPGPLLVCLPGPFLEEGVADLPIDMLLLEAVLIR